MINILRYIYVKRRVFINNDMSGKVTIITGGGKGIIKQWLDNNIRTYDDLKAYEIGVKNRRDESGEYKKFEYANTNERENEKYTRKPTDEEIEELRKSYENMRRNREKL